VLLWGGVLYCGWRVVGVLWLGLGLGVVLIRLVGV